MRDTQRSLVYKWEGAFWAQHTGKGDRAIWTEEMTLEECEHLVHRVWRSERGRYGRPKQDAPGVTWGRGCNATRWQIRLSRRGRNEWVVLHELAHSMANQGEAHGARFVGILIGLAARNIEGLDGQAAVDLAAKMGVQVDIRSVGAIPILREPQLSERILEHLPGRITQLAWRAGCRRAQVRGAAIALIRRGQARYFRGRLVPLQAGGLRRCA